MQFAVRNVRVLLHLVRGVVSLQRTGSLLLCHQSILVVENKVCLFKQKPQQVVQFWHCFSCRMFMYHVCVWSVALMFSVLPLVSRHKDRIFGFWFVNPNESDSAVCWIKVDRNSLSLPIWVLFFIPLLFIYSVCSVSLVLAYARLRRGISRTFLPRMKLLVTNTANVIVLILYWFVLIFF